MKKGEYANADEVEEIVLLGATASITEKLAKNCREGPWAKKLKTAATYLNNILDERMFALNEDERPGVARRCKHKKLRVISTDEIKMLAAQESINQDESFTLSRDVYFDLLEQALYNCNHCPQGERVKECKFKKLLHDISVLPVRTEVEPGECEFRFDNEIRWNDSEGNVVKIV